MFARLGCIDTQQVARLLITRVHLYVHCTIYPQATLYYVYLYSVKFVQCTEHRSMHYTIYSVHRRVCSADYYNLFELNSRQCLLFTVAQL